MQITVATASERPVSRFSPSTRLIAAKIQTIARWRLERTLTTGFSQRYMGLLKEYIPHMKEIPESKAQQASHSAVSF